MKLEELKFLRSLVRTKVTETIYNVLTLLIASRELPTMDIIVENVLSKLSELSNYDLKDGIENHGVDFLIVLFRSPEPNYNCATCKKILNPPPE